jgi:hypothetical protein
MRRQQDRLLAPVSAQARDEVRLPRLRRLDDVDLEPQRLKLGRQQLIELAFLSRRITGVHANDLREKIRGLGEGRRGEQEQHEGRFHEDFIVPQGEADPLACARQGRWNHATMN